MSTINNLVEKFQKYSDEELIEVHSKIDEYTEEGKEALNIVLKEKGGIELLKERVEKQLEIEREIAKIKNEVYKLLNQGKYSFEIKSNIKTNNVSSTQLEKIIEEVSNEFEKEKVDKKIKPRTILGSIIGGFIGGTIGGIVWGVQMIYSNHMFYLLLIGLVMFSYALIRLFTKQSKKNMIVLIMTVVSVIYALILGQIIFEIFGYVGNK